MIYAYPANTYAIDADYVRPLLAAVHLVIHEGRAAFFETGTAHSVPALLDALAHFGVAREAVDWVFITHVHLDHAGGAGQLMQALPNAKAVLHPRGAPHMIDPRKLVAASRDVYGEENFARLYGDIVPIDASRVVATHVGQRFALASREFEILHTPGHAMHHQVFFDHEARTVFTGDTFGLSYREFDVDGRAFAFPTTTPTQFDPEQLIDSIRRIVALQPVAAYFTHFGRVDDLPRIGATLERLTTEFAAFAREEQAEGAEGLRVRLQERMWQVLARELKSHGCLLSESAIKDLLKFDVDLNVDGLIAWLSRSSSVRGASS
jgi:glyoxylase-like metal-dependent hydrolase (beta-lactamase superfamily II)